MIRTLVPRVNADGNEVGGVPVVLLDAPLGTYMGWNITADGERPFHKGKLCTYAGGMVINYAGTGTDPRSQDYRIRLVKGEAALLDYCSPSRRGGGACSAVAQWQSDRLLTDWSQVRIRPPEQRNPLSGICEMNLIFYFL